MAILLLGGNSVVNFIEKYILPEKYRKIDNLILQFSMRNCAKIKIKKMLIFHVQINLNSDFGYRWKTNLARGGGNTPSQKTLNGQSLNVFSLNMIL